MTHCDVPVRTAEDDAPLNVVLPAWDIPRGNGRQGEQECNFTPALLAPVTPTASTAAAGARTPDDGRNAAQRVIAAAAAEAADASASGRQVCNGGSGNPEHRRPSLAVEEARLLLAEVLVCV